MSGPPWFYHPFEIIETEKVALSGEEVTHITGARRLRVGDELVLMNGRGKLAHCTLEEANKKTKSATLRVSLIAEVEPPIKQITLASALPKGDHLSTMLDMACQLGMTHFQPLQFEHSVSKWSDKLKLRCERILIEASKQSKSARIPLISPICDYADFVGTQKIGKSVCLLADQFGRPPSSYASRIKSADTLCILVGPEGGLSSGEMQLAQQHEVELLRLAPAVLRIETAAVAAVTALQGVSSDT